ncbi:TonB-dependent receptor [Pyxidicoccus fallax]|uniref:TonB-dependent receptor n=1 Tax=Pyxidicoccus fallax TaxID=394095 RepID=A0A848LJ88_9BACT|nr:TonB-dependent receptor [Pyxidicoccus fallax]NPC84259.1 TonB-dependent receptor [Pyxidicoccus fallax]
MAQSPPPQADAGVPVPAETVATAEIPELGDEDFSEEIVVVGLQRSMQQAQSVKRNADQIVDTVVAEDIGKLPDVTVSETAARIPGVQVDRARGEAAGQVLVRGLPDVTTTYNGREIFTAETRNVALADFPAGGIAALEVYKTTTANQVEAGLAGLIDVRSRRPLDFEGFEVSGSVRVTHASQSGRFDPNANLLVTDRWKTELGEVGALVNASYTRLNYLDSARWNSGVIATGASETGEQFRFPEAVGIFYGGGQRERPSVNASVQWRPRSDLEFFVDGLWQGYRDSVSDRQLEMRLRGEGARYTGVTLRPGTVDQGQSLTVENASRPFMFQGATYRQTDTFQVAVGGVYESGPLRITTDIARTDSRFDLSLYSFDQELATSPTFNVNFDVPRGPGGVEFELPGFDLTDPANFRYLGFFDRSYVAAGGDWQFRTDAEVKTGFAYIPKVEVGFRHTARTAYQENGQRYCANDDGGNPDAPCLLAAGTPLSEMPVDLHVFRGGFRGGGGIQDQRTWVTPTYDSIRDNVERLRAIQGFNPGAPERTRTFDANEQSFAWYGQARYEFKVGPIPVDGVVGARVVSTYTTVTTTPPNGTAQQGSGRYTDVLPSAIARVRLMPDLHLRLSANQTRTRPGFDQLRPTVLNSPPPCLSEPNPPPGCQITGSGGNPELEPVRSNNYDASLEYYFWQTGMASLAGFRRDLEGFITNLDATLDHPVYGPDRVRVNIPFNGGEGRIQGFEASVGSFFDFLPQGWLRGFGAYGNVTYLNDEQAFPTGFELGLGETGRIPNVSNWSYNLVAMYERDRLSARLAYNYRSRWITAYTQNPDGEGFTGEFVDGVSRLDFSASYSPWTAKGWENLTFTFDVSNILGNPYRSFRRFTAEGDTYPRDVRYEERIFSLGIRARI